MMDLSPKFYNLFVTPYWGNPNIHAMRGRLQK